MHQQADSGLAVRSESVVSKGFRTTRWSQVLAARDGSETESRQALGELCEAYWYPLYAFVRRHGHSEEEARDLTQAYFAQVLEREYLEDVEQGAGRFRSFLLASLKNFLANERDKASAIKRGGQAHIISLDTEVAESRYRRESVEPQDPEAEFERRWAYNVLERVLERLQSEFAEAGKEDRFEKLQGFLTGDTPSIPYRQVAEELQMTEGAVAEAVRRLRRRFGQGRLSVPWW